MAWISLTSLLIYTRDKCWGQDIPTSWHNNMFMALWLGFSISDALIVIHSNHWFSSCVYLWSPYFWQVRTYRWHCLQCSSVYRPSAQSIHTAFMYWVWPCDCSLISDMYRWGVRNSVPSHSGYLSNIFRSCPQTTHGMVVICKIIKRHRCNLSSITALINTAR